MVRSEWTSHSAEPSVKHNWPDSDGEPCLAAMRGVARMRRSHLHPRTKLATLWEGCHCRPAAIAEGLRTKRQAGTLAPDTLLQQVPPKQLETSLSALVSLAAGLRASARTPTFPSTRARLGPVGAAILSEAMQTFKAPATDWQATPQGLLRLASATDRCVQEALRTESTAEAITCAYVAMEVLTAATHRSTAAEVAKRDPSDCLRQAISTAATVVARSLFTDKGASVWGEADAKTAVALLQSVQWIDARPDASEQQRHPNAADVAATVTQAVEGSSHKTTKRSGKSHASIALNALGANLERLAHGHLDAIAKAAKFALLTANKLTSLAEHDSSHRHGKSSAVAASILSLLAPQHCISPLAAAPLIALPASLCRTVASPGSPEWSLHTLSTLSTSLAASVVALQASTASPRTVPRHVARAAVATSTTWANLIDSVARQILLPTLLPKERVRLLAASLRALSTAGIVPDVYRAQVQLVVPGELAALEAIGSLSSSCTDHWLPADQWDDSGARASDAIVESTMNLLATGVALAHHDAAEVPQRLWEETPLAPSAYRLISDADVRELFATQQSHSSDSDIDGGRTQFRRTVRGITAAGPREGSFSMLERLDGGTPPRLGGDTLSLEVAGADTSLSVGDTDVVEQCITDSVAEANGLRPVGGIDLRHSRGGLVPLSPGGLPLRQLWLADPPLPAEDEPGMVELVPLEWTVSASELADASALDLGLSEYSLERHRASQSFALRTVVGFSDSTSLCCLRDGESPPWSARFRNRDSLVARPEALSDWILLTCGLLVQTGKSLDNGVSDDTNALLRVLSKAAARVTSSPSSDGEDDAIVWSMYHALVGDDGVHSQ
jgi:hypothetical protein